MIRGRAALAIHGGCGVPPRGELGQHELRAAREGLQAALDAGWQVLNRGGPALDAVQEAVVALEEDPAFNAGRGAVLNAAGEHELDAAIMDGRTLGAGAVAAVQRVRNPVRLARAVMERTDHVLLIGAGAEALAADAGLEMVDAGWFTTPERVASLERMRNLQRRGNTGAETQRLKHGTVGAVALDRDGHLAAATSTGGYTNKLPGRVGDTPLIGAGTYANDATLAYSGTGRGEIFIRAVVGHELHARLAYRGEPLASACEGLVHGELKALGGGAGLIAVDRHGNISMPYNTAGMYRAAIGDGRAPMVAIFDD
jgi:beta-aspartyl-peptidase (threonine type)